MSTTQPTIAELAAKAKETLKTQRPAAVVQRAYVNMYLKNETISKLTDLESACADIVKMMPVMDKVAREQRKWKPNRIWRLGLEVERLSGLMFGIKYAALEHKYAMLEATGLTEAFVDEMVEAMGQQPYYSTKTAQVVEGTPFDIAKFKECIILLEDQYNIQIDVNQVTQAKIDVYNAAARTAAETLKQQTENTARTAAQVIKLDD